MLTLPPPVRVDRLARLAPGLAAVTVAAAAAFAVAAVLPGMNSSTAAVALGVVVVNAGLLRPSWRDGLRFASKSLLRVAVVLLGLQLSVPQLRRLGLSGFAVVALTVAATFFGTQLLGRLLGVRRPLRLLIATGFSICGASAVAGMEPVADGDEHDTAVAVALVTLCGSLAILALPPLRVPLGLDYLSFGSWTGASVHDIGQTVATANRVGHGALESAVVVKLTRVVLLAPLVAAVAFARRRRGVAPGQRRPAPIPLFVVGFLAAIAVRSSGIVPATVLHGAQHVQEALLVAALFGLGCGISWRVLHRTGGRPLLLGLLSWVIVAAVAYAGVRIVGV